MADTGVDVDVADGIDGDFNIDGDFEFDVIQGEGGLDDHLDWDQLAAAEFRAAYPAFFAAANADDISKQRGCDGDGAAEAVSSSPPPHSGVTDDWSLAGDDDDDEAALSAYVAELERFLLDDDDAPCPAGCGGQADEVVRDLRRPSIVDDYFGGEQLLLLATGEAEAEAAAAIPAVPVGGPERTTGNGEEEAVEDGHGVVLAAREDDGQSTSRKRARNKIKGTAAMRTPWAEPEADVMNLTMMHLARMIQVPAAAPWPPAASLLLCGASRMWPSGLIT